MHGYWGKTNEDNYHLLAYHSLDVAASAVVLIQERKSLCISLCSMMEIEQEQLLNLIGWTAALHDLGKLSPAFQRQDQPTSLVADALGVGTVTKPYDVRHDSLGWVLWNEIESKAAEKLTVRSARALIRCSTGHHGMPPSKHAHGSRIRATDYFNDTEIMQAVDWVNWATNFFKPIFPDAKNIEAASWWIAGTITLADWIGSNVEWNPYSKIKMSPDDYFLIAISNAKIAMAASGVDQSQDRRSFSELFPRFNPTPIQAAVAALPTDENQFLLIIEETTGGGKTEAALASAGGSRFFFGLPSMATANGLWNRVGELDGQQVLIHGKNWAMPGSMDRASSWLANGGRKALLADIGVGTIDQAMVGVLYARYGTLRLAGLAGKTLIVDEIHAYDAYMKEVIMTLISMHARSGGSVVLLSATMPLSHRVDYADAWCAGANIEREQFLKSSFPLITYIDKSGKTMEIDNLQSRYELDCGPGGRRVNIAHCSNYLEAKRRVVSESASGRCVLWIRNTVGEAIQAYNDLSKESNNVQLFHSKFTVDDRSRIEKNVLKSFGAKSTSEGRKNRILVATQVVEQSLDIDFDFIVTDLCPIDLLIQRAGRLHRHERGDRGIPTMLVYGPPPTDDPDEDWAPSWSKGSAYIYADNSKLWITQKLISDGFSLPCDARRLVEGVYGELPDGNATPKNLESNKFEALGKELAKSSAGVNNAIDSKSSFKKESSQTDWDDSQAPTRLGEVSKEWVLFEDGKPISGCLETSTISIELRKLSSSIGSDFLKKVVGKFQEPINLINGMALGISGGKTVHVTYSKKLGLVINAKP